jgi:hypothetical protein
MFDVVVPLGPDDVERCIEALPFTQKNVVGYRRIHIVTQAQTIEKLRSKGIDPAVHLIDEAIYPFDLTDMAHHVGPIKRRGWYLQQLLKLYAGFIIPGIASRWLIIDADTFFLKPTPFIKGDKMLLNVGTEYSPHYFLQIERLLPGVHRVDPKLGGITHHMMFEAQYVKDLFERVEAVHKKPFWRAFMDTIDPTEYEKSGASEYELYFNFMLLNHRDAIELRWLNWENTFYVDTSLDRDYISAHEWMHQMFLEATKQSRK